MCLSDYYISSITGSPTVHFCIAEAEETETYLSERYCCPIDGIIDNNGIERIKAYLNTLGREKGVYQPTNDVKYLHPCSDLLECLFKQMPNCKKVSITCVDGVTVKKRSQEYITYAIFKSSIKNIESGKEYKVEPRIYMYYRSKDNSDSIIEKEFLLIILCDNLETT